MRNVFDTKPVNTVIIRYQCIDCSRTFRYYPQGVDRSPLSRRIRRLAALLWMMDVSTREVEDILENLGISINRMTVWREGQKLLNELSEKKLLSPDTNYKICRSNGNGNGNSNGNGNGKNNFSFSICLDSSTIAMLGILNTYDQDGLVHWLEKVVGDEEIEILDLKEFDFKTAELLYVPR